MPRSRTHEAATLRNDADGSRPVVSLPRVSGVAAVRPPHGATPREPEAPPTRRGPARRWLVTAAVAVVYLALAVLANRSAWAHGVAQSVQTSGGNDVPEEIWFLAQTPWVLLHGHNPLVNNWLNAPAGVNLMDNTTMTLLGVVGFPITVLFGPIATYNVLIDLAIFASALSFFAMARRFVDWWPAAFVGGLVYGFSPFTAATANAHLFLLFQAVPPLVILFVDRFVRSSSASPWWSGLAVGLCFVAEFYVSTEAFASLVVMTGLALVVAGAFARRGRITLDRRRLLHMGGCAVIVIALGTGYGAWVAVAGPAHITGSAQPATVIAGESIDPAGLVIPTLDQHFTLGHAALGNSFVAVRDANWHIVIESPLENGSYIGVPLLIALVAGAVVLRRRRIALFSAGMGAVALVLSFGPHLHVDGHLTDIPLPFIVLAHIPLLSSSEAARWETYFWLFAALLLALMLQAVYRAVSARDRFGSPGGLAVSGVLAVVLLLPLVPAWPYPAASASVPTWFTTGARALPAGSSAVIYPWASSEDDSAMLWQAMANMQFRMPGGFAVIPGPNGANTFNGQPSALEGALANCQDGARSAGLSARDVRTQLRRWHTRTVVVVPTVPGAACAEALFTSAFGRPQRVGGVVLWQDLSTAS
jgi:hypothetical protein